MCNLKLKTIVLGTLGFFLWQGASFAADPPASQQMSGEDRTRQLQDSEKKLRQEIEKPKEEPQIEEKIPKAAFPEAPAQKILVTNIKAIGASIIPEDTIKQITAEYLNKELTLNDMQKLADLITDLYRKRGLVTSRAYLPPQKIENGNPEIRVIEAVVGDIPS